MSSWLFSIGWLRFTVPTSTIEILKTVRGEGDWIRDEKGYEGYREVWFCRGNDSGYGRIATGAKRNPREVHVDLSQELISHWPFEKFHKLAQWVLEHDGILAGSMWPSMIGSASLMSRRSMRRW